MSKTVAKQQKKETGVTVYRADVGEGFEDEAFEELQVPYLQLIQDNSKLNETKEGGVPGAKTGLMVNSVTHEIYGDEVVIIPCKRDLYIMESLHPDFGRKIIGRHDLDADVWTRGKAKAGKKFGKIRHPDEERHQLILTMDLFCMLERPDLSLEPIIVSFSSTKMTAYKLIYNTAKSCTVPTDDKGGKKPAALYSHRFRLKSFSDTNDRSQTYANWIAALVDAPAKAQECMLATDDPRYIQAAAFRDLVISGAAKAVEQEAEEGPRDGDGAY